MESIGTGSFGEINKCNINGRVFAYKSFFEPSYIMPKIIKLNKLSEIEDDGLITPKFWVKDGYILFDGYLTTYCEGKTFKKVDKKEIIPALKHMKNTILRMHSYNLIHGDLHLGNMMYEKDKSFILDFDNSSFKGNKINIEQVNDYAAEYIKKYGINKALDVFTFNLTTFSLINNCNFWGVRMEVDKKNYGYFSSKEAIELCNQFFLEKTYSDEDFLIDMIDETKITL